MTFQRIDLLPRYDLAEGQKARSRWTDDAGEELHEKIVSLIRKGAGEDFLQWDFEEGRLGFLENQWDLAGFDLFKKEITFPKDDNFENIDFSHAQFWHCTFINATFPQTHFTFVKLYNVEFRNCLFAFAHFYGATLEKCRFLNCDFVEENGFTNCSFTETVFLNCFFNKNKFTDCEFDEGVSVEFERQPQVLGLPTQTSSGFQERLEVTRISGIYRGIKEGFLAGKITAQAHRYSFLQQQAYTRFNRPNYVDGVRARVWELLAGYGLRPA